MILVMSMIITSEKCTPMECTYFSNVCSVDLCSSMTLKFSYYRYEFTVVNLFTMKFSPFRKLSSLMLKYSLQVTIKHLLSVFYQSMRSRFTYYNRNFTKSMIITVPPNDVIFTSDNTRNL